MPRLVLLLTLACVALLATPAHAAELLAVLELSGDLPDKQRRALTDAVRRTATDSVASAGIKVMTQENMETLLTDMGMDASCISEGACEVGYKCGGGTSTDPVGSSFGDYRVFRGGGWGSGASNARVASRYRCGPS